MKMYKIMKIIFADDIQLALKNEMKAEIVSVELANDVETPSDKVGFRGK